MKGEKRVWIGMPVIFPSELVGEKYHISYEVEMVEVGS